MCQTTTANNEATPTKVLLPEQAASAGAADDDDRTKKQPTPPIHWTDFFNPWDKPWVLVPNGSLNGYWDWVPQHLRVGPWSIACCCYLAAMVYAVLLFAVDCFFNAKPEDMPAIISAWSPNTSSSLWWLNLATALWTSHVALCVLRSPMGFGAWMSYTLQSWTLIILRTTLSTLAPWLPATATTLAEMLRFPMLAQATITFGIWNALLMPVMLFHMPDNQGKKDFRKLIFGFLLTQLHVCNIAYAGISGIYGSPRRALVHQDLAIGLVWALGYIGFYLFILDRVGVHFYFIFSPRTPLSLLTWSLFLGLYIGCFSLWKSAILTYGWDADAYPRGGNATVTDEL